MPDLLRTCRRAHREMSAENPTGGRARWIEGNRLFSEGRYSEAALVFTEAIASNAGEPAFYHNRAVARAAMRDTDGAIEDAWRAIELDPRADDSRDLVQAIRASRAKAARSAGPPEPERWARSDEAPETTPSRETPELPTGADESHDLTPSDNADSLEPSDAPPMQFLRSSLRMP